MKEHNCGGFTMSTFCAQHLLVKKKKLANITFSTGLNNKLFKKNPQVP
jgi:hypothetical protein